MKDIKYIIKRILIGTGIAFLLMLIKGNLAYDVYALDLSTTGGWSSTGYLSQSTINNNGVYENTIIHNDTRKYYTNANGYFLFSFSYSSGNLSTLSNPGVSVIAARGSNNLLYPCYFSSSNVSTTDETSNNHDGNVTSFTAVCPMKTDSNGVSSIQMSFVSFGPWEIHWKIGERSSFIYDTNANQIQQQTQELNEVNNNLNDLNDSLNDDNVNESSSSANSFFNNFDNGDTGNLTDIISLPLDFLNSLNNSCSPINLTLPFINTNVTIPCISTYLSQFIPSSLLNLIRLVINALISYRAISSLLNFINGLKDPNNSDLEVMDL